MDEVIKHYFTWHDFDAAMNTLVYKIRYHTFNPSIIVALSRGGLIPGVKLSHMLNLPLLPIRYSSKDGHGEFKQYENILPRVDERSILIIDDISDSGNTLKEVVEYYESSGSDVRSVTWFYKESSCFEPDVYALKIPSAYGWIVFPWEE